MEKIKKMKIANTALVVLLPLMLFSSVLMEVLKGGPFAGIPFVWIAIAHVVTGIVMAACVLWHLYLHFGVKGWLKKFGMVKSRPTKINAVIATITLISGIIAMAHFFPELQHGPVGGIHGKIGLLFIIFAIGHTAKRWKWFKSQYTNKKK